ncbi:MAG TPA: hypothetical protein VGG27_02060 [Magnetospirillaceae bacterium]|jgi:hypothetical protein
MTTERFPEAVLLHRGDGTGFGFFFKSEADFQRAIDSFSKPILKSFQGPPIPNQPDPQDHLRTATATLIGQAFDRAVPGGAGPEAVSWAVAACVRTTYAVIVPTVVVIERRDTKLAVRAGEEYLKHPGFPMAVVVHAGPHGGTAHFYADGEAYRRAAERDPDTRIWLPQIVYRLYERTPSVVAGKPVRDLPSGKTNVEFSAFAFGREAPLIERAHN